MAVLAEAERNAIHHEIMREQSSRRESLKLLSPELRAGINAIDDWVEVKFLDFNSSLPLSVRTNMTKMQKFEAFAKVVNKKLEALRNG